MNFESDNDEIDIIFTPEDDIPFYMERSRKPLEFIHEGQRFIFTRENCYVVIFRDHPEYSYAHVSDDEDNEFYFWNMYEFIDWLSGFKWDEYSPERSRNNERETMKDLCGWEATTMLADEPGADIKRMFEFSQLTDLYKATGRLTVEDIVEIDPPE